jgi:hypothetical protein
MPEYHVGCGLCGIYAGVLNKKGDDWKSKSDITDEAMAAVAQFLLEQKKSMKFEYHGKEYRLLVCKAEE